MRWVLPGLQGAHVGKGPRGGWDLCFRSCGPAAAGLCAECHPHTRPVRVQASCEVAGAPSRNARWRPATSQQRSLSARRRAGGSPAQAVSAGSAGRAGGGTGRGGARGRGCAHVVRPVLPPGPVPRTDGRPGTAPGTGTRRGGRGARGSRAPAGREDAADTYLLPRLPLCAAGPGRSSGSSTGYGLRRRTWRAARSAVFTFRGRSTLCRRPLSPLAGSAAAAWLLPEGRALGSRSPALQGRPGYPGAWEGPALCPAGPSRSGLAPRDRTAIVGSGGEERAGGRAGAGGGAPSARCSRGARRWSAERDGGARSGRAALRPLGARPSVRAH